MNVWRLTHEELKVNDAYKPQTCRQVSPRLSLFVLLRGAQHTNCRHFWSKCVNSQRHSITQEVKGEKNLISTSEWTSK